MHHASVFVLQADVPLLLKDDLLVLRSQAGRVAREYEGVAVLTCAVL